ncbi:hypothetical protein ABFO59_06500 [Acinetobacter radioresistens]|uniref:hypothetical protein n=1 Tax=Acinetobacter radioresistens TaxID=40216 RepID=UPI0032161049
MKLLQTPEFKRQLEDRISGHITEEYLRCGQEPPLPKLRQGMYHYDDPKVTRLANRLRTGAVLIATLMDDNQKVKVKK